MKLPDDRNEQKRRFPFLGTGSDIARGETITSSVPTFFGAIRLASSSRDEEIIAKKERGGGGERGKNGGEKNKGRKRKISHQRRTVSEFILEAEAEEAARGNILSGLKRNERDKQREREGGRRRVTRLRFFSRSPCKILTNARP